MLRLDIHQDRVQVAIAPNVPSRIHGAVKRAVPTRLTLGVAQHHESSTLLSRCQLLLSQMAEEITGGSDGVEGRPIGRNLVNENALIGDAREPSTKLARQGGHAQKLLGEMQAHGRPVRRRSRFAAGDAVVIREAQLVEDRKIDASAFNDGEAGSLVQPSDDQRVLNGQFKEHFYQALRPRLIGCIASVAENVDVVGELESRTRRDLQNASARCPVDA